MSNLPNPPPTSNNRQAAGGEFDDVWTFVRGYLGNAHPFIRDFGLSTVRLLFPMNRRGRARLDSAMIGRRRLRKKLRDQHGEYLESMPKRPRRIAMAAVVAVYARSLQIKNLKVVRMREKRGVDHAYVAGQTGLSLRRCKDAWRDLCNTGLIGGGQPKSIKHADGTHTGLPCERFVRTKLIDLVGLWERFEEARARKGLSPPKRHAAAAFVP